MDEIDKFDPQKYNIINTINETRYSINYLVENKKSRKRYIAEVNKIRSKLETDVQKQFISNEIKNLLKLDHPIIDKYVAFSFSDFENNKNITIIKNSLVYKTLSSILDQEQHGICPEKYNNTKRQIILLGICFGMMYIHSNHILHGNLSTENIYVDDNFQPIISNYGLTHIFDLDNTSNTPYYGNFIYLAPEKLKNNEYNEKSEVYSFGMMMYEVIFGCKCFSDIINKKKFDKDGLKMKIINGLRPKFIKPIKKGLQELIEKCWSAKLSERPTFSELYNTFKKEAFDTTNKQNSNYLLDDVDVVEVIKYIEKIQNENDEFSKIINNYQTQIDSFKTEMESMKETIENQTNEIKELKKIIINQSEQMNSKIMHEHCEVQNMREYILKQIRKEFVLYKMHCYPTRLLSNLDEMFHDHYVVKLFSKFCINKMCIEYYLYVEDMNAYYAMKDDLKSLLFYDFRDKYFKEGAPYFLNIKTSVIKEICEAEKPSPDLLDKALDLVYTQFRVELIRKFKHSAQYNEYLLRIKKHKSKKNAKKRHKK